MRVIGGVAKGRRLKTGKAAQIRPTSDYIKEVIFDVLQGRVSGVKFLDLFAGTGNVGIEALSRGAQEVTFVDSSPSSMEAIDGNLEVVRLRDQAILMRKDALPALRRLASLGKKFAVVFIDPPYQGGHHLSVLSALTELDLLEDDGLAIVEHFHKDTLPLHLPGLKRSREIRHGETKLSFYIRAQSIDYKMGNKDGK